VSESNSNVARSYCRQAVPNYQEVVTKVSRCPAIASLRKINESLKTLTASNDGTVNEIADVISRDMSLTSRLLRQVNSVFSGLSVKVTSLEEAIFYLGLRQIRQLAITTRVVDEIENFGEGREPIDWQSFWRHSIGTGIITREVLIMTKSSADDDTYYLCGLLQDIGKLVMFNVFPDQLWQMQEREFDSKAALIDYQQESFGWDYTQIGGLYLEINNMPQPMVESVLFQGSPGRSRKFSRLAAGVQLAEMISRFSGCHGPFEQFAPVEEQAWEELESWDILFGKSERERQVARAGIANCIDQFPTLLKGLL
jgi:HD-like signal output (HDOD) protein